jgi:hypothetical protein
MTLNFKRYLAEYDLPKEKLVDLLEKKSPGTLKELGGHGLFYRGASNLGDPIGKFECGGHGFNVYRKAVRKDRVPLEMNRKISAVIDDWFNEKFGFRARSQSLFCYGEAGRGNAETYGSHQCAVFPIGDFQFVWSPKVGDLFLSVDEELITRNKQISPEYALTSGNPDPEAIKEWMDSFKYTDGNLSVAMKSDSEIMLHCNDALYIPYAYNTLSQLHEGLGIKK